MKKLLLIIILLLTNFLSAQTIDWSMKSNPSLNSVNSVTFRTDGQKVLSGTNCHPASIRIFDVVSSNLDWDYTVGSEFFCVMGATFSSNTNYIAAIEEMGNIFLFDNSGSSPVIMDTINTGTSYGFSTAISPSNDKVAVGCSDGKLKIYSISNGTITNDINAHPSWVTTITYSPNGSFIISGGSDDKVKIWDNSGVLLFTCSGHTGDITNVKVTPDNNYVISSSKDDKIKVWDINTGLLVKTIIGHTKDVNGIDISPDGSKIVSASSDSTCKIWDFNTGNLLSTFAVLDSGAVNTVAWSPLGDKIVTGNVKSDVVLWSVPADLNVGENTFNSLDFILYPNPANSSICLNLPESNLVEKIVIMDIYGKPMIHFQKVEEKINVQQLSNGLYFIQVEFQNHKTALKSFIKE